MNKQNVQVAVFLATLALVSAAPATAGTFAQSSDNGHYYLSTDTPSSWVEANALAVSLGGYLVSITSAAENTFILDTFITGSTERYGYWIGLNDTANEGTFVWTSGEAVSYNNWEPGEPNNYSFGVAEGIGEDYGVMNWQYANGFGPVAGRWNDAPLFGIDPLTGGTTIQPYRALIEFNVDPFAVPEPSLMLGLLGIGYAGFKKLRRTNRSNLG